MNNQGLTLIKLVLVLVTVGTIVALLLSIESDLSDWRLELPSTYDVVCLSGGEVVYKTSGAADAYHIDGYVKVKDSQGVIHRISGDCLVTKIETREVDKSKPFEDNTLNEF